MDKKIEGSIVALVTPMQTDGEIDYGALKRLIDFHLDNGTNAIVVAGTTGESSTLDVAEHETLLRESVQHAAGRIAIIAGTGANSTREAVRLTEAAHKAGADACLSVTPYYNRPTQEGLYRHFEAVAQAAPIPTVLYNVPGRTASDIRNETILRLAELPNIIGIKDATGDMIRAAQLARLVPPEFLLLSGDDLTALPYLLLGGVGIISVTANVAPAQMARLCALAKNQAWREASRLHLSLMPLHQSMFVETNPIPVKWAVAGLGLCNAALRLPLVELSRNGQVAVNQELESLSGL